MAEIIPKVKVDFDESQLCGVWYCKGCGKQNIVYLFSECPTSAKHELKSVNTVSCLECCRKYDVD